MTKDNVVVVEDNGGYGVLVVHKKRAAGIIDSKAVNVIVVWSRPKLCIYVVLAILSQPRQS